MIQSLLQKSAEFNHRTQFESYPASPFLKCECAFQYENFVKIAFSDHLIHELLMNSQAHTIKKDKFSQCFHSIHSNFVTKTSLVDERHKKAFDKSIKFGFLSTFLTCLEIETFKPFYSFLWRLCQRMCTSDVKITSCLEETFTFALVHFIHFI